MLGQPPRLPSEASAGRAAALTILAFLALRLATSAATPLIADEAYAVVVTRFPTLSYFDHPPLGFDFARLAAWLFGSEAPFVVRLPHVLMGALSGWLLFLLTRRAFGARAGFWAVAAYSVAPFFFVSASQFAVPDGPLNLFLLLTLWLVLPDLVEDGPPRRQRWLLAGLSLAAALLSKYTAVLFGLGAFVVLATTPRGRRLLASPWPWLAGAIALAGMAPVLAWNLDNDWASFGFQSGRAVSASAHAGTFLLVQLGQALFLLPWIWVLALWVIWRGLARPQEAAERIFAILAAIPVLLFDAVSVFSSEPLAHWAMPGFLFAFPLVGKWCAGMPGKALRLAAGGSAALVVLLAVLAAAQMSDRFAGWPFRLPPGGGFDWTVLSWNALERDFGERGILAGGDAYLLPASWLIGGKAGTALGPGLPVAPPVADPRHFAYMHDPRLASRHTGYAVTAAWPRDVAAAKAELAAMIDAARAPAYRPVGEPWIVTETRNGEAVFDIVVQQIERR